MNSNTGETVIFIIKAAAMYKEKMEPLQLILGSNEQNDIYFNLAFSCFESLLEEEESGASAFRERLNAFSVEDVSALSRDMQLLITKTLQLNEHKTIIVVCVLYYVCYAFLDDKEEAILARLAGESPEDLLDLRNRFLSFSTGIVNFAKPHFSRRERFAHIIRWLEESGL